jgi:hypothetical protein
MTPETHDATVEGAGEELSLRSGDREAYQLAGGLLLFRYLAWTICRKGCTFIFRF